MRGDWPVDAAFVVWLLVGVVLFAGVAFALASFVGSVVFALFVYYASRPAYRRIEPHTDHPDVAVTATLLLFVLPLLAIVVYGLFVALTELLAFLAAVDLEWLEPYLGPYAALTELESPWRLLERLQDDPAQALDEDLQRALARIVGPVRTVAELVYTVLTRLFLVFVVVFYLLRDDYKVAAWFRRGVGHDHTAVEYLEAVDRDLGHVFYGNMLTSLVTAFIAVGTYLLLAVAAPPGSTLYRPVLLGALVGVGTFVPVVGMKVVYLPFFAVLALEASTTPAPLWFPLLYLVATFLVVDAIPDFFVRSYLSSGEHLHMGLVLLGYVFGAMAFGWYGLFLGPILLVATIRFARDVFPELVRRTV